VTALSKKGWRLQKAFKELEEWSSWVGRSAEKFVRELDANPPENANIRKGLHDLQKLVQKLDKDLKGAGGRKHRRKAI